MKENKDLIIDTIQHYLGEYLPIDYENPKTQDYLLMVFKMGLHKQEQEQGQIQ